MFLNHDSLVSERDQQQKRFNLAQTIAGTRSFHSFIPLNNNTIAMKRISSDSDFSLQFKFDKSQDPATHDVVLNSYVCAIYDKKWYIAIVEAIETWVMLY